MRLKQFWNQLRRDFFNNASQRDQRGTISRLRATPRTTPLSLPQQLERRLMLTSNFTEVLNYTAFNLSSEGTLEIEIGGTTAGNPAGGSDADGFDQINVNGSTAVVLDGMLNVRLVNDYVPAVGTTFDFLNISAASSISGKFSDALGLYAFPDNDRYFDVVSRSDGGLRLEVKALPGGLQFSPPDSQRDAFGRFLSSYFDDTSTTFSCAGRISVDGFATFSGTLVCEQSAGETRVVGSAINVQLDQRSTGVEITDASFGLIVTSSNNYAFEATGTAALTGLPGFSMSGTFYAERSTLSADIQRQVTVNGQSVTIDVGANARRFAGDDVEFDITGFASVAGDFAFDLSGTNLTAVATNVTATMQAGPFSAGLTNASMGLILTETNTMALEALGGFSLTGSDLALASADSASLRYNTTNEVYTNTTISIGSVNYAFTDVPAAADLMVLSATGLSLNVGDFVHLSGDVGFQRIGSDIEAVAANFAAEVRAGAGYSAGVSSGTGALLLNADGTRQLYATGEFLLSGGDLGTVSGTATVAQNTANSPVDQRTVSVDGITVLIPQMAANLQSVSATTAFTVQDFFHVSGSVAIEKSTQTLAVSGSNTPVAVQMLTIGGSNISAFAGSNAGTADAVGLSLTGVSFGVMFASPLNNQSGQDQRTWTAAKATAEAGSLLNTIDFLATGTDLSVALNKSGGTLNGNPAMAVADFTSTNLTIPTAGDTPIVLDFNSELLEASGTLYLTVSEFLYAEGNFAVRKSTDSLKIGSVQSSTSVDLLTIGASDVSAFAGVNGGTDDQMGLALGGVNLAIVVATSQTDSSLQWTALKATVGNVGFVGIDGLTMSANDLSVDISRPDKNGQLVNFSASPLTVSTGPNSSMTLNYAAADGPILRASGSLEVDLFGFVSLSGSFAVQKSETQVVLADDNSTVVDVELLTIGAKDVNAFAGVNGGSSDRMGLALSGVEFGLALATSKTDPTRNWTAFSATASSVEIVGVPDVTLSATDLALSVNRPDSQGIVLDFSEQMLFVKTGTMTLDGEAVDTGVTIDFEGSRGSLLEASGTLTLGVGGFFNVSGSLAVTKSSETLTLSDASLVNVDLLTIGGSGISAFAGVNYNPPSGTGLSLTDTEFAFALATDRQNTARKWTTLQANVGSVDLTGISGVTMSSSNLRVLINRAASDETLVDYSADSLEVSTGQSTSLVLDVDGALGPVLKTSGNLTVNMFDFFSVSGSFAVEKRRETVTLSDATTVDADLLTLGGTNISAFAGLNGPPTNSNALGFSLGDAEFGLAIITDRKTPARKWTTLQATAGLAEFVGGSEFEVSGTDLSVAINRGVTVTDSGVPASAANTQYRLQIANDTVGALTFTYQPATGSVATGTATIARSDNDASVCTKITTALAGITGIGSGNVSVTGSRLQGFTIEFIGTKAGTNLSGLTVSTPGSSTGSVTVSQLTATKVGVSEVQTITITASQPPAPTITTTVTQLTNGAAGSSHVQEIVIDKPASPTPSVSAIVTETTDGYTSTSQIRQLTINKPVQTTPTVTTSVTESNRGVAATSEIQQIQIQRQDPPKPVIRTSVTEVTPGKGAASSIVYFQFYNGTTGGNYTLSYGERTKTVNWSTSDPGNIERKLREGLQYVTRSKDVVVRFVQSSTISQPRFKVQIRGFSGTVMVDSTVPYVFGSSSSGANETQQVTVEHGTASGSFRLGLPNNGSLYWTGNLLLSASASEIQTALNSTLAPGSVTVTRTDLSDRFVLNVTFSGTLAAQNLEPLQVQTAADTPTSRGTFTLSCGGQTTAEIMLSSNTATQATEIQTALRSLSTIGTGNVQVTYDTTSTASAPRYNVVFSNSLAGVDASQITASGAGLSYASVQTRTVISGTPAVNEQQTVTLNSGSASGTFRLSLTVSGRNYTTTDLAFNATGSNIQAALNTALGSIGTASVTRPGASGASTFDVTFAGALAGKDLSLLKIYTDVVTPTAGGSFTLSYGGQTTAAITLADSTSLQASQIQQALQALSTIGAGNISVNYDTTSTNADTAPRFLVTSGTISVESISASGGNLTNGASISVATTSGSNTTVNEVQTISLETGSVSGTFTITVSYNGNTWQTAAMAFDAAAATIQSALNAAINSVGTTTVARSGSAGTANLTITFGGGLSGKNLDPVTVATSTVTPTAGGSFTVSYGGQTTRPINLVNGTSVQASLIQLELQRLSTIGSGNVEVTWDSTSSAQQPRFRIALKGSLASTVASTFTVQGSGLSNANITTSALTTGKAVVSETQRIVMNVGPETGTFKLAVPVGGAVYQTTAVSFAASASTIQTELNAALATVSGTTW